jgi:hypothetical protein
MAASTLARILVKESRDHLKVSGDVQPRRRIITYSWDSTPWPVKIEDAKVGAE